MSEPNDINERVTRLEGEVVRARQDAAEARVLAVGADRDVSTMQVQLRAHTRSLEALRTTQLEQGNEIHVLRGEMREGFARVDMQMREGFARVDAEARKSYTLLAKGQQRITDLLTTHIEDCSDKEG